MRGKRIRRALALVLAFLLVGILPASAADRRQVTKNTLSGKSILFVGDSLTSGYGLDSTEDSWPVMLEQYGMETTVISVAGSTAAAARGHTGDTLEDYTAGGCYYPICQRPLPEGSYDIIFVECGANDKQCAVPLASSVRSRNTYTFQGAVNVLLDRLEAKYPDATIVVMTCFEAKGNQNSLGLTEDDYSMALMDVCKYRGISCYYAADSSISGIHAADENFRERFFLTSTDSYHLNAQGQALFLPRIADWIAAQIAGK